MGPTSIAWLRNDLRIAHNPALAAAVRSAETVWHAAQAIAHADHRVSAAE